MKKLLGLIVIFLLFFLLLQGVRRNSNIASFFRNQVNENLVQENYKIAKEEKQEVKDKGENVIYIPYHWKYGHNLDANDVLLGTLPNIKFYIEDTLEKDQLLYGVKKSSPLEKLNKEELFQLIEKKKILYSKQSVKNISQYFSWNNQECYKLPPLDGIENLYTCKNWTNWYVGDISNIDFVYTDCKIMGKEGYCLFSDYAKDYYSTNQLIDNRCLIEKSKEELLCDVEKYLNMVILNNLK
jgi:hypothetical protein